jgi:hypothetical protein
VVAAVPLLVILVAAVAVQAGIELQLVSQLRLQQHLLLRLARVGLGILELLEILDRIQFFLQ